MLLITGITGHSGRWLLKNLEAANYKGNIRCVVRKSSSIDHIKDSSLNIDLVYGDLSDEQTLNESMEGVETVIHISGINYSKKLVEVGHRKGVDWFILVHTTGRFSRFKSASAGYIKIEDSLIKTYKNLTILRPTMIYGSSLDRNIWKLVSFLYKYKFFPVFGEGKNLLQPVHAKDLGDAYFKVLMNKEATLDKQYDLSGKDALPYIELLKTVSRKLNRKTVFLHFPIPLCIYAAKVYNFIFPKKAIISVEQVMRMNEDKAFSFEKAREDFGFSPLAFEEGINDEIKEYISSV